MQNRKWAVLPVLWISVATFRLYGQSPDTVRLVDIEAVSISTSFARSNKMNAALGVAVADGEFMREYFTGNLIRTLEQIPGVRSMDIGSGFSKPVIRGMGFNRIAVLENGIKQEGQQWGADHGLEIDAFNAGRVVVRKGPSSLMYGSDAMGGTIEITPLPPPLEDMFMGEAVLLGRSVNGTLAGSVMLGVKRGGWFTRVRYSEQHFADYRVPADTVVYLTQKLPILDNRLRNTAGRERDASLYTEYRGNGYFMNISLSNANQKAGFFPGAHGIPDASRLTGDGSRRNIELPYSVVNHLKASTRQQFSWERFTALLDVGFQNNRRTEMSAFHTHYGNQPRPENDSDKELFFALNTVSATGRIRYVGPAGWEHTAGIDWQYQHNGIGGYSFLLPGFTRNMAGAFWISSWKISPRLLLTGGLRYDRGTIDISAFNDTYLEEYLIGQDNPAETVEQYRWRSYAVKKHFGDISGAAGVVWQVAGNHILKANIGRSFRLPGANELASNGVHHGTFRHEQGDAALTSERGWQADLEYSFEGGWIDVTISPFASRYNNYIYLRPTGEWSLLPHAGQVYRYTGAAALFAGGELSVDVTLPLGFGYSLSGEYIHTRNLDEKIPLSFTPPATMRNTLWWTRKSWRVHIQAESIARQDKIARNELPTAGANTWNAGVSVDIGLRDTAIEVNFSLHNILDRKYYNHLSFYRHVEIPEPGRNLQLMIKLPFKTKLK